MNNLLTFKYWYMLNPGPLMPAMQKGLLGLTAAFLIGSLALGIFRKKYRKGMYYRVLERLYYFCLANFFAGLVLSFFTFESIPFFSSRFWFLLWGIVMGVWLYFILKLALVLPIKKMELQKEREFKKYIP